MRKYAEGMLIGGDVYADIKDVSQNVIYVRFFTNIEMVATVCLEKILEIVTYNVVPFS